MKKLFIWLSTIIMVGLTSLAFAAPVDINTADAATLAKEIHGVGLKKANAIISYREQNGPFANVDDLKKVKGISQKIIDTNRANLTLSNTSTSKPSTSSAVSTLNKPGVTPAIMPATPTPAKP
ncbi:competence protein ComEA [Gammaproteobacteria bacterium]